MGRKEKESVWESVYALERSSRQYPLLYRLGRSYKNVREKKIPGISTIYHSLGIGSSLAHWLPFQYVLSCDERESSRPLRRHLVSAEGLNLRTLCALSSSRAVARRASCLPESSSALERATENELRNSGALVPLWTNWPRPLLTAVSVGATPPTAQTVPKLT